MDVETKLASEDFEVQRYIRDVAFRYDSSAELKQHKRRVQGLADQTAQKLKQKLMCTRTMNCSLILERRSPHSKPRCTS